MITIHYFKSVTDQGWKTFEDSQVAWAFEWGKRINGFRTWRTYAD